MSDALIELVPPKSVLGEDYKSIDIIAKEIEYALEKDEELKEKWELTLMRKGYNIHTDDVIPELKEGKIPSDDDVFKLFCEIFGKQFGFEYEDVKAELELIQEQKDVLAYKRQEEKRALSGKEPPKDKKPKEEEMDLLHEIISRDYLPEDIAGIIEDKDENKSSQPFLNRFIRKENLNRPLAHEWVIYDVIKSKPQEETYQFHVTGEELAEKWLYNEIYYNSFAQRGIKNNKAIFDQKEVKEIIAKIINGTMDMKQITLVLEKKEGSNLEYDEETKILNCYGEVMVNDGQHRLHSLFAIYMLNLTSGRIVADLSKWNVSVELQYGDIAYAGERFGAINSGKVVTKAARQFHEVDSFKTLIEKLEFNTKLKNKISYFSNQPTVKELVTFPVLKDAFKENIEEPDEFTFEEEYEHFKFCFNYLAHIFPNYFGNDDKKRAEKKKVSMLNQNYMFYGLIALFSKERDREKTKQNIESLKDLEAKGIFNQTYINENTNQLLWLPCLKPAGGTKKTKGDWVLKTDSSTKAEYPKILLGLMGIE